MMFAWTRHFAIAVAVVGGVKAQNGTGKAPLEYVDTLIGTINGGMAV